MAEISGHGWLHPKAYFRGVARGWKSPGDVGSLLMIVNGDIVQKALAQISGPRWVPVAFSFGWVVYSIQALSTVIGTGRLMPAGPDWDSIVVNVRSGHARANRSWILGRLLRDWDYQPTYEEALCITVFEAVIEADLDEDADLHRRGLTQSVRSIGASQDPELGLSAGTSMQNMSILSTESRLPADSPFRRGLMRLQTWVKKHLPKMDHLIVFAWVIIGLQVVVAAMSFLAYKDASTLIVTAAGTAVALWFGSSQQWTDEKWLDEKKSDDSFCLLQGNGCCHVMLVYGKGIGYNFEHLAGGWIPGKSGTTRRTAIHAFLWVVLLIAMAREEGQTWSLLIIGGLGMVQNIVIAGAPRPASAFRFHLKWRDEFRGKKVLQTLCAAERKLEDVGFVLRPIFFPGKEQQTDIEALTNAKKEREGERERAENAQNAQPTAHSAEAEQGETSGRVAIDTESGQVENRRIHTASNQ